MTTLTGVVSYPVPPYFNVPIEAQFYSPSRLSISNIARGITTTITTSAVHEYVIGQEIRLIIPPIFGSYQLNETKGYVISIPTTTSVVATIDSTQSDAFIPTPYTAVITNIASVGLSTVVTANNSFRLGNSILFTSVGGMTQINGHTGIITAINSTSFTVSINSSTFTAYASGGQAALYNVPQNEAQILAIGDINSGINSLLGNVTTSPTITGSFINISPA
jgi:hypothetical protein